MSRFEFQGALPSGEQVSPDYLRNTLPEIMISEDGPRLRTLRCSALRLIGSIARGDTYGHLQPAYSRSEQHQTGRLSYKNTTNSSILAVTWDTQTNAVSLADERVQPSERGLELMKQDSRIVTDCSLQPPLACMIATAGVVVLERDKGHYYPLPITPVDPHGIEAWQQAIDYAKSLQGT